MSVKSVANKAVSAVKANPQLFLGLLALLAPKKVKPIIATVAPIVIGAIAAKGAEAVLPPE